MSVSLVRELTVYGLAGLPSAFFYARLQRAWVNDWEQAFLYLPLGYLLAFVLSIASYVLIATYVLRIPSGRLSSKEVRNLLLTCYCTLGIASLGLLLFGLPK